jgi:hypothetical protein
MTKATRKAGKKLIPLETIRQENYRRFGRKPKKRLFLLGEGKLDALGSPIVAVGIYDKSLHSHATLKPGRLIGKKVKLWIERVG